MECFPFSDLRIFSLYMYIYIYIYMYIYIYICIYIYIYFFFSVFPVFLNRNEAKFNDLRLLLNRCQSLCQKGFACVLINLLYKAAFKHVAS